MSFSFKNVDWCQLFRTAQRALFGPQVSELDPSTCLKTLTDSITRAGFVLDPADQIGRGSRLLNDRHNFDEKSLSYIRTYQKPGTDDAIYVTIHGNTVLENGSPRFANARQIGIQLAIETPQERPLYQISFEDYTRNRGTGARHLKASIGPWKYPVEARRPLQWLWTARNNAAATFTA